MTAEHDFNALIRKYDAAFLADFGKLSDLAHSLVNVKTADEHFTIIQERTMVVWETFTGILAMIALQLTISGFMHCRTLYENVMVTLYLLYEPARRQDYLDHAKVVAIELMEAMGRDPKELDPVRAEYQALKPKFTNKRGRPLFWHKMSIAQLVASVDAERAKALGEREGLKQLHKTFYRQASTLAHGEGLIGLHFGDGRWYYDVKNYDLRGLDSLALNFSYWLVVTLCESVIRYFKLPLDKELAAILEISKKRLVIEA